MAVARLDMDSPLVGTDLQGNPLVDTDLQDNPLVDTDLQGNPLVANPLVGTGLRRGNPVGMGLHPVEVSCRLLRRVAIPAPAVRAVGLLGRGRRPKR